jgi:lipoate-protein ligase A
LKNISGLHSQSIYHAVAYCTTEASPGTVIVVSPEHRYASIGYHQVLEHEIDLPYCERRGIPVIRREVGGGAVLLDQDQLFFQCVFPRDRVPLRLDALYGLFLQPVVNAYRRLGVAATFGSGNDLQVGDRKICGTGAGRIEEAAVVVGNILFDFDYREMCRILRLPSEAVRRKVHESMRAYLTTLRAELDHQPDREATRRTLIEEFERVLGVALTPGALTSDEQRMVSEIDRKFTDPAWLHEKGGQTRNWIKISNDVRVVASTFRCAAGDLKVLLRLKGDTIDDVEFAGDVVFQPKGRVRNLENALIGLPREAGVLLEAVESFFQRNGFQAPGVRCEDLVRALMGP